MNLTIVLLVFFSLVAIGDCTLSDAQVVANRAQEFFRVAQTFQIAGDYEQAAAQYRLAISQALRQMGNLKVSRRELDEGCDLLAQAVSLSPEDASARVDLAAARFQLGQMDLAESELKAALHLNPSDPRANVFAGKLYFLRRDYEQAIEHLQTALQAQPDFETAYVLALANLAMKKPLPAGIIFDEMLASSKPDAGMRVLIGLAYRENGYFEQAGRHFAKAFELDPNKRNVHAALGINYFLQGEEHDGEARKEFLAELGASPHDYTSLYYLGLIANRTRDAKEAISWLDKAIAMRPESDQAYLALGEARLHAELGNAAVDALRKALQLMPQGDTFGKARVHTLLSQALEKIGRGEDAKIEAAEASRLTAQHESGATNVGPTGTTAAGPSRELQRVLQGWKDDAAAPGEEPAFAASLRELVGESFHNLGVIDARASRFAQATTEFEQAAKWKPGIQRLDRNWGLAAFRAQRYDQAIAPLSRELQKNENDAALRQMLGLSYFMMDQFAKSAETFRPIVDQLPDNPGLLYAAGASLVRSGNADGGRPLLLRMQKIGANSAEAHVMIAQAYSDQSHFEEALSELAMAEKLNPSLADLHFAIGLIYVKQGKPDDAEQEFQKELVLNPRSVAAKYQIASVLLQRHQTEKAIAFLREVLIEKPGYGDGHYQLGKALLESGDTAGAIAQLEESVKLQPDQPYGYYQLSLAYRRSGRSKDADAALRSFQELKESASQKARQRNSSP